MSTTKLRRPTRPALTLFALALFALLGLPRTASAQSQWTTNGNNINNTNTGNVGINTASPGSRLDIGGKLRMFDYTPTGASTSTDAGYLFGSAIPSGVTTELSGEMVNLGINTPQFGAWNNARAGGLMRVDTRPDSGYRRFSFQAYPTGSTSIFGVERFSVEIDTGTVRMGANGGNVVMATGGGNVGIGTSTPNQKLGVQGMIGVYPQVWVPPTARGMFMFHDGTTGAYLYAFNYPSGSGDPMGISASTITFSTYTGMVTNQRVTIANNGNLGIGTATPTERLHVEGNVVVAGNIAAKYQDVAEWVPSTQNLSAGTVVVLDTGRANHVLASTQSYDTGVAGVITEMPGLILGEAGEGKVKVATTGRVKVKVNATRAPVKIGDLLVTSDIQGVAMKSEPITVGGRPMHAPGTIIGKALEPLEKGVGEILVLLSMQ